MAACPNIGKSNIQAAFVEIEDTSGVLQKPTAAGYILPSGAAEMNQAPEYTASEELSESLNTLEQFRDAFGPGEVSLTMLLRPSGTFHVFQGDALLTALMGTSQGRNVATLSAAEDATASATTVKADGLSAGGIVPPRGVLGIGEAATGEYIHYTGATVDADGVWTFTGCTRGYAGSTAAAISEDDPVRICSRVYVQKVCRPTVSVWMKFDHFVAFMAGCVVTQATFPLSKTGGQQATFSLQGRRMGWCGTAHVASVSGAVVTLGTGGADAYTVGAILQNKTRADDNSGAGYTVTAVDVEANTITVSPTPSSWAAEDALVPWLPEASAIGSPLEARDAKIFVDGTLSGRTEGELSVGTPTSFASEIGDEYPGENADGKREIQLTGGLYFRKKAAQEFGRGLRGAELPVVVTFGSTPKAMLAAVMPRVQFGAPTLSSDGEFLTLSQDGSALGVPARDGGESALYLVTE